jgi:hypothetical protein
MMTLSTGGEADLVVADVDGTSIDTVKKCDSQ